MKRLKNRFQGLKLNIKFTLICTVFVLIPVVVLSTWVFTSMEENVINERVNNLSYKLSKGYDQAITSMDSVNMSTQFFLSDQALKEFLVAQKSGNPYDTKRSIEFYNEDIASLERMINNNSALYQIRVYVDSIDMQEMMPILYRMDRMYKQPWAQKEDYYGWNFGYKDSIFDDYGKLYKDNPILSLVTPMEAFGEGVIGIIEVTMYMETMFPMLYDGDEKEWTCFVDDNGEMIFAEQPQGDKEERVGKVLEYVRSLENVGTEATVYYSDEEGHLICGYQPLPELGGALISVSDIGADLGSIAKERAVFVLAAFGVIIVLALAADMVVRSMLKQFYSILHSIREVQKGDLDVVIQNCGRDEMGELGNQINKMLGSIKQLTETNLKHELLVKNTEIRALQNQINAHFIYNVLESIKMMAEIEEKYDISDAITALGKLLRYSMRWTSGNVTVGEELEYIRNYLSLINLRFDYEIYLSENIPEVIYKQEIPKLSLQPIVENAIYHGIEEMAEDTSIYIKGFVEGDDCVIEITDAGKGMDEEEVEQLLRKINGELEASGGSGNGIGLKNVQDRIKVSFGERYGIEIASKLGCYTKIMVRIPITHPVESKDVK
ncbi:MAG: sensor histidine kinase [Lachnospiraceae bacterium]|nr:sensor histidine kinase [Lachnospiraceae bacterium]